MAGDRPQETNPRRRAWRVVLWGGWLLLLLSACAPPPLIDSSQPHAQESRTLDAPIGQTFVAQHGGLAGVELYLAPQSETSGPLTLHLRAEPGATSDLASASLPAGVVTEPGFYRFAFPPLPDSHGRYYYAVLDPPPGAPLTIGTGLGHTYLQGALYRNGQPENAHLSFRLVYDPWAVLLELAQAALAGLALLAAASAVFLAPGLALVFLLEQEKGRPARRWAERLGLAAGLGLAIPPLLLLWLDLLGLRLGAATLWLASGPAFVFLLWRAYRWRQTCPPSAPADGKSRGFRLDWADAALIGVLALIFAVRLLVIRTLDAPSWGDSVQHAMMTQLILDWGGLFHSWEPYAPYQSLTIHYGFSTVAAFLAWATGLDAVRSTLVAGQLVNGIAVFALYPLAVRVAGGNRWAGVGAVLVAGLASPMPAFYVNWGRYAQLTGQAILPVALWLLWESAEQRRLPWRTIGVAALAVAGMTLSYYRMPFYLAAFMAAWLLVWALPTWWVNLRAWLTRGGRLALAAALVAGLFLPWVLVIRSSSLAGALEVGVNTTSPLAAVLADYQIWRDITIYVPELLLALSLLAGLLALLLRRRGPLLPLVWTVVLASLVAGRLIGLPGANLLQNFAVLIALYMPVSLLCGWLLGQLAALAQRRAVPFAQPLIALSLIGTGLWFARPQLGVIDPSYIVAMRPDIRAMAWIREHTPPDALFLAEGFRVYDGYSVVGADGGWWIPLLAGRRNTMPPQYAILNEREAEPGYNQRVVGLAVALETTRLDTAEGVRILCDWGITHAYVGQAHGYVGFGAQQLYSPDELLNSPAFELLYHEDRVYIFRLLPESCVGG